MTNADKFYAHLDVCCHLDDGGLCPIGLELLYEAADEFPPEMQSFVRWVRQREQRKREADANFEFYNRQEEI